VRMAVVGAGEFALAILEAWGKSGELGLVVAQPDRPAGRSSKPQPTAAVRWAREHRVRVEQPERVKQGRLASILASVRPDLAVVAAYGRIVPPDALAVPSHGCLNVHASLLPELRGAAPAQWAVARGYRETGVTIMQMDEGLDTGDIRLQKKLAIAPAETGETLLAKLSDLHARALTEALKLLAAGKLPRVPQDHSKPTLPPILTRDDPNADFPRTAHYSHQRPRHFTPSPA